MKKAIMVFSFVMFLSLFSKMSFSQTLYFCTDYDDYGTPSGTSSTFYIPNGGGYFYFLVKLPYELNCTYVSYEIYTVDNNGYETFNTTIDQTDMSKTWVWFAKKVTFYTPGYYHVYVRDCFNFILADSFVTIYYK